jgi:hypothetical protein
MILLCDLTVVKTGLCVFHLAPVMISMQTSCGKGVAVIRREFLCLITKMSDRFLEQ